MRQDERMRWRLALLVPALLLAACDERRYAVDDPPNAIVIRWDRAPAEPLPLTNNPPDSITINWDPSRNVESDVKYIAERHCLVWDEHAEAVRDETRGTTHSTEFVCKGPLLR
jgi:hypothetical protein